MSLFDGPDVLTLYPEVLDTDGDGNPVRVPDLDNPVQVTGRMQPASAVEDGSSGQTVGTVYRFLCRSFPAGTFAAAAWGGRRWEIAAPPTRRPYGARVGHDTVTLTTREPEVPS